MDWRERVNAKSEIVERGPHPGDPGEPLPGTWREPGWPLAGAGKKLNPVAKRPCLYIGASGQRCNQGAIRGDFCPRHSTPDPEAPSENKIAKRAIAVGGVVAVLWPLIWDLLRALFRFLR